MTIKRELSQYYGDSEWGRSAKVTYIDDALGKFYYVTHYQDSKLVKKLAVSTEREAEIIAEDWTLSNPIVVKGEN
jgi:hypothetical protein